MLTYSFENIGEESLYEHLYRCIRADILAVTKETEGLLESILGKGL